MKQNPLHWLCVCILSDKKKSNNPLKPSSPKNNYQIWLLVAMVLVVVGLTYFNKGSANIEIYQAKFEKMLKAGDVKQVLIVRKSSVEITLTEDALKKDEYKKKQQNSSKKWRDG